MADGSHGLFRDRLLDSSLYYGWYVVIGCFLLTFMTAGTIFSFSVFLGPVIATFDQSAANTSLVFGLQSLVTFSGAAILGFGVDRYGVRRLLAIAAVLIVVGLGGASQAPTFLGVVVGYSVVAAAGLGITFVVAYTTPPRWFERRRGLATGVAVSGWGVGILVMPPLVDRLIDTFGWQGTYLWLAAMFLVAIAGSVALLATRPSDLEVDVSAEFDDPTGVVAARSVRTQVGEAARTALTPMFGLVFVGLLFAFVPAYAVLVFLVEFAESTGAGRRAGVLGVSALGAMNIVAKFAAGEIADRVGPDLTMAGFVALMCVVTPMMVAFPTPASIVVLAALFGFGYGGIAALMSPLMADLFGTADLSTLFGLTCIGFAVGGTVIPYLVGFGFDVFGTYDVPFLIAAVLGFAAAGAFLAIRALRPTE